MTELTWKQGESTLIAFHRSIYVSNKIREPLTQSPRDHVVLSTNRDGSDGVPYKPAPFPVGIWRVYPGLPRTSIYTAPYFIPTDAHQLVEEWQLDEHGLYKYRTGRMVDDYAYGMHHSEIDYTFGCIRILGVPDVLWLVEALKESAGDKVELEVL